MRAAAVVLLAIPCVALASGARTPPTARAGERPLPGVAGIPAGSADHFVTSRLGPAPLTTSDDGWRLCYAAKSRGAYVVLEFEADANGSA